VEETSVRGASGDDLERSVRLLIATRGCRSVDCYERLNEIEEGSYGVVYRARDVQSGVVYALKQVKMENTDEGFSVHALREISILMAHPHTNVVAVREMVVGSTLNKIYMVMEFVDHDVKALMDRMKRANARFSTAEIKCLLLQLLSGVAHLHDNWIIHRDLKASNLLYSSGGVLKIADLGLARHYGSPLRPYSPVVVTLAYRAPELLLGARLYSAPIDMWSVGCLFAEFLKHQPLFGTARSEIDLLDRMFKLLGTVTEAQWPGLSQLRNYSSVNFYVQPENRLRAAFSDIGSAGFDLLSRLLTYDPSKRATAKEALQHAYFAEAPRPTSCGMMPTWPSTAVNK
jgi:cell division cycle 2-like protein